MTADKGQGERKVVRDLVYLGGMCPRCEGMGQVSDIDLSQLYDDTKSLTRARSRSRLHRRGWYMRTFAAIGIDPDKPIRKYTKQERHLLLYQEPTKVKVEKLNLTYEGLIPRLKKSFLSKDVDAMQPHIRAFVERAVTFTSCPDCGGTRLNEAARSSKIKGKNIADVCAMQISDLAEWTRGVNESSVAPLLAKLRHTLDSFVEIGLGYLSLDRPSGTLLGGEAQRTKMIGHLGSSLTDVTYVFDKPTIGLHPHDIQRMNDLLLRLRDKGNTVLVVEHKPETIAIADHVVDLGPGAGTAGGEVVFAGTVDGLRASGTLAGRHLSDRASLKSSVRKPSGVMKVRGARARPHEERRRRHPDGRGRAGGGDRRGSIRQELTDSRLSEWTRRGCLGRARPRFVARVVEPGDVYGSPRSDPQRVREGQRRQARVVQRQLRGRVSDVQRRRRDLYRPRDDGRRHHGLRGVRGPAVPSVGAGVPAGKLNIAEVLDLPVEDAVGFFGAGKAHTPAAHAILKLMSDVGLGYLRLGQPLTTLSGGERQRLKLATHMGEDGGVYVLDEPTTGLHLADLAQLLGLLDRLVDSGKSVIVIEHHLSVMAHADSLIDLGPGAGHDGRRIVFEGTPADLVAARPTLTGEHLAAFVGSRPKAV